MVPAKLGLYAQPELSHTAVVEVGRRLRATFPVVPAAQVVLLEPPAAGWDSFRGQFDIHYLLAFLQVPSECDFALWLVEVDVGDAWHSYLFGAADNRRAIVSAARLKDVGDICKEACHEVGHLLGLAHCFHDCVMRPSRSERGVCRKSGKLCESCRRLLGVKLGVNETKI